MTFPSPARQMAVFAFMALVTGGVLALLVAQLPNGLDSLGSIVVYGVTAAFGIEFLVASWPALWDTPEAP